jgi:hypothetical protein
VTTQTTTQTPSTLAQQFAAEHAAGAVPAMLKTIRTADRFSKVILIVAMATSYIHQALFLYYVGAGPFGFVIPLLFDTAMIYMLKVMRTVGMARAARRAAAVVFGAVTLVSGFVNAAAPGTLGMRALYAFVVLLVIGVEIVSGLIRPDFTAIEARAAEVSAPAPATTGRKLDPEVAKARAAKAKATREANAQAKAAREAAAQDRAAKAARTRKARQATEQAELDLMLDGFTPEDAPVSPAPATH